LIKINRITSGIEGALQGRTAGVQITRNSGTPGVAISVKVRGSSSITGFTINFLLF